MNEYQDYGWDEEATHAHSYLYKSLQSLIGTNTNQTILDIGCGNGVIANRLIKQGYNVYGIDASTSGIDIARKKNPDRFFVQNIADQELPIEIRNINFNLIISTEVIEHLYNPRGYIAFCKEILMKNGSGEIIISTPYHGYLKNLALAITGKMEDHFTVLWDGGHIKFWSLKTLTQLLNEYGFEFIAFKGSGRVPYLWKSMFIKAKILHQG